MNGPDWASSSASDRRASVLETAQRPLARGNDCADRKQGSREREARDQTTEAIGDQAEAARADVKTVSAPLPRSHAGANIAPARLPAALTVFIAPAVR
jgi:hypothetical protein